jgi:hypothetical protein
MKKGKLILNLPKANCGNVDRIIRAALSVALLLYCVFFWQVIGDVFLQSFILVFAILNLISTTIGWCPIYQLANINTCKSDFT